MGSILSMLTAQERISLLHTGADGAMFTKLHPGGSLPLTLALCLGHRDIIEELIRRGANLDAKDKTTGNSAIHSLIVHEALSKEPVVGILQFLLDSEESRKWYARKHGALDMHRHLLKMANHDGYTPLTLAAKLGVQEVFTFLLGFAGVYKENKWTLGSCSCDLYDMSEIDPVIGQMQGPNPTVIDLIVYGQNEDSLQFLSTEPLKSLSDAKWSSYRVIVIVWGIIHTLIMITFSIAITPVYSVQPRESNSTFGGNSSHPVGVEHLDMAAAYVQRITEVIPVLLAVFYLVLQLPNVIRNVLNLINARRSKQNRRNSGVPWTVLLKSDYFWIILMIFNITTIAGVIMDWLGKPQAAVLLAMSLVCGWYFCLFFLQGWSPTGFSVFMIHRMIWRNVLPLACTIAFLLIGFSMAFVILSKVRYFR